MQHRLLPLLVAGTISIASAAAQNLEWSSSGRGVNVGYGGVIGVAGDVDGDGFDDVIVGDPDASPAVFLDGQAKVLSGVDGTVIYTYVGAVLQGLGWSADGVGDLNGDGHAEFVIASVEAHAVVYSGIDGSQLAVLDAVGPTTVSSVAGTGDINLDGIPDVIIGSSSAAGSNGRAWVFSGAFMVNGTPPEILMSFDGQAAGTGSGISVDGAGDVDGDRHPDLIVGQSAESGMVGPTPYCGIARVYSGSTGFLIRAHHGPTTCTGFGFDVAGVGDLDGDGLGEVIVGAPFDDTNGFNAGGAWVYDGATGAEAYAFLADDANDHFGRSVDGGKDVNGDGRPDLLIGAPVDESAGGGGAVWIRSGLNGSLLSVIGETGGGYGIGLAGGADFDGDGYADFAAGAPSLGNGNLYAYSGICTGANYGYCTAAPNSHSPSGGSITASGPTSISADNLTLLARQCPPNQSGVFFYGTQQQEIPFADGTLCVGGSFYRLHPVVTLDANGIVSLPVDFDGAPLGQGPGAVTAGDTRFFSFWFRDPTGGPVGFNYTNGRVLTFCP